MRGAAGAADRLVDLLDEHLSAQLRSVEAGDPHLTPGELGEAQLITSSNPGEIGVENQPAVVASVLRTTAAELDDLDTFADFPDADEDGPAGAPVLAGQVWVLLYSCRLEVSLTAPNVALADRWRYGWLTAVRQVLLVHRHLGADAGEGPAMVGGAAPLFTEAYDDTVLTGGRAFTRALIDFPLLVAERLDVTEAAAPVPVGQLTVRATTVGSTQRFPDPPFHPSD